MSITRRPTICADCGVERILTIRASYTYVRKDGVKLIANLPRLCVPCLLTKTPVGYNAETFSIDKTKAFAHVLSREEILAKRAAFARGDHLVEGPSVFYVPQGTSE